MDEECLSQYILFVDWTNLVFNEGRFIYQFRQVYPWSMFPLFIINGWVSHQTQLCDFQVFCRISEVRVSYNNEVVSQKYRSQILKKFCAIFMQISSGVPSDFFEKQLHYCTTIAPQKSC